MELKDVKLKKGMSKEEINELIGEWIELADDVYLGNAYKHNWKCKCGERIESKTWGKVKSSKYASCEKCKYNKTEMRYKCEVEKTEEYEYIRSFRKGEITPKGKAVGDSPYIEIKHKYCKSIYEIKANNFINDKQRCSQCCGSYEDSFEYYIEKELGLNIDDHWDYQKNDVKPNLINKFTHNEIWIKCKDVDYHESYLILPSNFIRAVNKSNTYGCPYCHSKKIHPKDSFAQYHIDNTDPDFLEKFWSKANKISPWEISPRSNVNKVWIKCNNKNYHKPYKVVCTDFTEACTKESNYSCPSCRGTKVHVYDSFGYHNLDKTQSWSPNNNKSPFKVSKSNGNKYEFICPECGKTLSRRISDASKRGVICNDCSKSKGEKAISKWLSFNEFDFVTEKEFCELKGLNGGYLRYDFYLKNKNLLIEYDGEFHFEERIKNCLKTQQEHDKRKDEYARLNNIRLIRIPYWQFENIESILELELINKNKLI